MVEFFSSQKCPDLLRGPPSLQFNVFRGLFPGVKRTGPEVNHPPPSSSKAKNMWSYSAAYPTPYDVDRTNFTVLADGRLNPLTTKID